MSFDGPADFETGAILTCATGVLMCHIDQVYELLNYLTRDNLYTHQLPRAARACRPYLVEQHPWLDAYTHEFAVRFGWRLIHDVAVTAYGATLPVRPLPDGAWESRDPLAELAEMGNPLKQ